MLNFYRLKNAHNRCLFIQINVHAGRQLLRIIYDRKYIYIQKKNNIIKFIMLRNVVSKYSLFDVFCHAFWSKIFILFPLVLYTFLKAHVHHLIMTHCFHFLPDDRRMPLYCLHIS